MNGRGVLQELTDYLSIASSKCALSPLEMDILRRLVNKYYSVAGFGWDETANCLVVREPVGTVCQILASAITTNNPNVYKPIFNLTLQFLNGQLSEKQWKMRAYDLLAQHYDYSEDGANSFFHEDDVEDVRCHLCATKI